MRKLTLMIMAGVALFVFGTISPVSADNRSDQMNPNNDAYWQSRGYDKRPDNWNDPDAHKKRSHDYPVPEEGICKYVDENGITHFADVPPPKKSETYDEKYSCDGKIYCSEMTSCAEAEFYLRNCPGTRMDGDGDGVPCESRWCGR